MLCPFCGSSQVIVNNSRPTVKNTQIWRRRKCLKCKEVFTTMEKMDVSYVVVQKKNGRRVQFSQFKLYSGIYHIVASKKNIDRGEAAQTAQKIIQKVETILIGQKIKEITSGDINKLVFRLMSHQYPDIALKYFVHFNKPQKINDYCRLAKKILKGQNNPI